MRHCAEVVPLAGAGGCQSGGALHGAGDVTVSRWDEILDIITLVLCRRKLYSCFLLGVLLLRTCLLKRLWACSSKGGFVQIPAAVLQRQGMKFSCPLRFLQLLALRLASSY